MNHKKNISDNFLHHSEILIKDSFARNEIENTFIVFNSIDNILYLIYSNKNFSIISFNLIDSQKINEIKNAHDIYITSFSHFLDKQNNRDLIISISSKDNNIKLWNVGNWEVLHNFKNINSCGELFTACVFNDKDMNYIITSNSDLFSTEPLKIFDFKGNKIIEINDSNVNTFFIEIFNHKNSDKKFIVTGNFGYVLSYDYNKNKAYNKYQDDYNIFNKKEYIHIIIYDKTKEINLISSNRDGNIRIWDFDSGELLKKYNISNKCLRSICLWNNELLFVGCDDFEIKIIDLKDGKIVQSLKGHYRQVLNIKKIFHSKYKECIISKGLLNDYIILWKEI
jgi:WD40 repeat protein